ncbi:MAG: secretion protein F [Blautia sp.]|nr:secretion protein F [Blautia sp.]MCM1199915.1 hypothetical protein [Bacteroides fragilis]
MVYWYLAVLVLYLLLFFLSRKEKISVYRDREAGSAYPGESLFLKAAVWCIGRQQYLAGKLGGKRRRYRERPYRSRIGSSLKLLRPDLSEKYQVQAFYVRQYSHALLVFFAGSLLSLSAALSARTAGILREDGYIERKGYGQGDIDVELSAQIEGEEPESFFYTVAEQKYTPEETERMFQEAVLKLPETVLGGNESLENVTEDLNLAASLEGYPFQISWESGSYSLVQTDGSVQNGDLQEAEVVMLTARFRYEEQEFEECFPVRIGPAVLSEGEQQRKRIEEALAEQDRRSRTESGLPLPAGIGTQNIVWKEVISDNSGSVFLLVCVAAVLVLLSGSRGVERRLAERDRELLKDYPEVIHKLVLYMGAGMTVRNAFGKMGEDYKKQKISREKRYVYEEILLLCHELQSGASETEVYAHLGKRCRLQPYRKLSALLSQNLRKGNSDLLLKLRQEAAAAFEERKNRAKKAGEEAGTKLLLPMMMMLCIVMVLIMIPAYFTI